MTKADTRSFLTSLTMIHLVYKTLIINSGILNESFVYDDFSLESLVDKVIKHELKALNLLDKGIDKKFTYDVYSDMQELALQVQREHKMIERFLKNNKAKDLEELRQTIDFIENVILEIFKIYNIEAENVRSDRVIYFTI